ncbi:NrtR DNA-binding winged helix domain-containing protein [Achromobacter xylosoxidans]|jgi:hypothetical protein|uniref:NrtR DNA-binding winged helix domain-containing protein n=1 Tax=Alcaligenes xylosoxydans xylosoxydans TaxID=85698 RepID=UPI0005DA25B9|nr:hypothetical protein [Achromobacter xylosoxidans]ELQ7838793.1 hypothetical protein [Pseudomonas aeruginosa]MDH0519518.1 hypothetical protein [Achromobacter xylosoxidans]MDH0543660.1 hypothetical protein [Achromobacter xylosoxidans]QKQ54417.1 hypothetical protein FOC83_16395 [Achromobacter xylosoxidans]QPR96429.1 hypothetical protein I6G72_07605 [Achromobacter xylosoxidans]
MSLVGAPEIIFVVNTVAQEQPLVLTVGSPEALPCTRISADFPSLTAQVNTWLERCLEAPSSVEQLYTYAERHLAGEPHAPILSVSYLSVVRAITAPQRKWKSWYDYLPWEDRRAVTTGSPFDFDLLLSSLERWLSNAPSPVPQAQLRDRIASLFGLPPHTWRDDQALSRLQMLHAAGLVSDMQTGTLIERDCAGRAMEHDHRRILATAVSRVRAKLFSRALLFSFAPPSFTLLELQLIAEAILGRRVHKQNFRRWAEPHVVPLSHSASRNGHGRPARLFSIRTALCDEATHLRVSPRSDRIISN